MNINQPDKQKAKKIAIKVVVTFLEAAVAAWVATGYKTDKVALAGIVGAGVSAAYNLTRHYLDV